LVFTLSLFGADAGSAQANWQLYQIGAVRVDQGPEVDGVLDESVWETAAVIDAFIQQDPDEGAPATERTEVRVLYDVSNIYFGVRAFESSSSVIATEMRRDADRILEEDNFQLILDTFGDSRSAYMFVVTPLGAQLDQQVFDDGGRGVRGATATAINRNWDGVWSVSARRTPQGWVAEIAIPMVTLRFPEADPQAWGINFMRNIRRKNEQVFWAPIPRAFELTRVSLAGSLTNLESLDRGNDLRIKPYVTGGGHRQLEGGIKDNSKDADVGLDVKYGVTASLNLDVTINTDFAQAEVDEEQVNLTRFPLFLPEKREFFLENAGQFAVGTTNSTGRIADLFFSRRIGLTSSGENVPILGGARLTGKVGRNNIAIMDLQTDRAFGEPGENFFVTRYRRDIAEGSQVGGVFINREAAKGGHFNRTYAADMTLVLSPFFTIDGFLAGTSSPGISDTDNSTPGRTFLGCPRSRQSCSLLARLHRPGTGGGHIRAGWLDRRWRIYGEHTNLGDNFNPEVGFVPRVGIRRSKFFIARTPRPERWGIRLLELVWNVEYLADQTGRLESRRFWHRFGTTFENGTHLNINYNRNFERLDEPFLVGAGVVVDPGDYAFWDLTITFTSNPARRFFYRLRYSPQTFYDGDRTDMSANAGLRVTSQLATSASFSRNDLDLPSGAFKADIASFQVDYSLSPTLSLRSIAQYNSTSQQWSASARFRYIYRPGSDIYIVYDEVRRDTNTLVSPFVDEFRNKQLIVKMTYLLSM
jgi:hypothetical protein